MNSTKVITEQRMLYWAQFIRDCKASGISVRAFCANAGVRENIYYYWQKKLRNEACEQFLMSQMDDEQGDVPRSFTQVVIQGDTDYEIAVQGADFAPSTSLPQMPIDIADKTTISSMVATSAPASAKPTTPARSISSYPTPNSTQQVGQIHIEIKGVKISADALYPMDKLDKLLERLVRV